jgi:plastocyanin
MPKRLLILLLTSLLLLALSGAAVAAETAGTQSWNVSVGKEQGATSLDSMFPKVIYIHEGDTVKFTDGAQFTPHTVTFLAGATPLNPQDPKNLAPSAPSGSKWDGKTLINSGMLEPGKDYSITFTKSGAFSYYCILHPLMTGTVVVVPAGASIPSLVEQTASVKSDVDDLLAQAEALQHAHMDLNTMKNADGSVMYMVDAGMGHRGFSTNVMMPETIFINEGDSVKWMNDNQYEPHFVTFNKPDDLSFFGPHGDFNPKFMAPAGGAKFDGTGFTNSGMILAQKSYTLTFTKAGTYKYECYLHSGSKMTGTVVVAPKDSVKVTLNGKPLVDAGVQLYNNHVYAPMVPLAVALGGTAVWNEELRAVVVGIGGKFDLPATLQEVSGVKVVINGHQFISDLAPQIIDGHSYAPLQDVVSLLGGSYSWNEATQTFSITINNVTSHGHM